MSDDNTIEQEYMLTTVDNPFNPFTQFNEWHMWDVNKGYNTAALLARVANISNSLSEPDQAIAIQEAIDEIVLENVSGMFRKITKDYVPTTQA
jgi:hypothetical protein